PPLSTLFPYTTLFRSRLLHQRIEGLRRAAERSAKLPLGERLDRGINIFEPGDRLDVRDCRAFELVRFEELLHRVVVGHAARGIRSEEHTSELQSRGHL